MSDYTDDCEVDRRYCHADDADMDENHCCDDYMECEECPYYNDWDDDWD